MTLVLMTLAGSGLVGCLGSALILDRMERSSRPSRRLDRPQRSLVVRERAA